MTKAEKIERKILWISFSAGLCFAFCEFVMAIYSRSQSVLMDAAYDSIELAIIGLSLCLTPLFHKPVTEKRPFGYSQVESVYVVLKGFMMVAVTLGLSVNSIQIALSGGNMVNSAQISLFQVTLGGISLVVLVIISRLNKTISSPIMDAEIYGWRLDACYSLGMAGAFFASTFFRGTFLAPILPYFDQIVAVLIVLFMLPNAIRVLHQAVKNMFLFAPEQETVNQVREITYTVLEAFPYEPVFFDITRTGRRLWVSVYFMTTLESVQMPELREATRRLNQALSAVFDDCVGELIVQT